MPRKKQKMKNYPGYLMVEAVISIFIVGLILVSFTELLARMYNSRHKQVDYVIAANLAQGGIEMVRNERDNNLKDFGSDGKPKGAFDSELFRSSSCCGDSIGSISRRVELSGGGESVLVTSIATFPDGTEMKIEDTLYAWGEEE